MQSNFSPQQFYAQDHPPFNPLTITPSQFLGIVMTDREISWPSDNPVKAFKLAFRRRVHNILFGSPILPSSLSDGVDFDPANREMLSNFTFFEEHWNELRRFPHFSVVYLILLASLRIPEWHSSLLRWLIDLTTQTPSYGSGVLTVVVPGAFELFSEPAEFILICNALFDRFGIDETMPLFNDCLVRAPDSVQAYRFLEQRLPLAPRFDEKTLRALSEALDQVEPSDPSVGGILDRTKAQVAGLRQQATTRVAAIYSSASFVDEPTWSMEECFAQIESGKAEDPIAVVRQLWRHLRKVPFPDRLIKPTMHFVFKAWSGLESHDSRDGPKCLDILKKIHRLPNRATEILAAYYELSDDRGLQKARVELGYSDFRRQRDGLLPSGREMPYSMAKAREVDSSGELAILQMQKLSTIYDGVANLWELVKAAPDYDIVSRFEEFNASQKCFLVSGFRVKLAQDRSPGHQQREQLVERLEKLLYAPKRNVDQEVTEISERLVLIQEKGRLTPNRRTARVNPMVRLAQTPSPSMRRPGIRRSDTM
jgi:hypothetical protein